MLHQDLTLFAQATRGKRLLSLDLGEKTIGLAMSDTRQVIASPLKTLKRDKFGKNAAELHTIITEHTIGGLVIGLALHMDGGISKNAQAARQFALNFCKMHPIATFLQDERLSTVAVTNVMIEADLSRAKRAENVDKLAACYILQSCLDKMANL